MCAVKGCRATESWVENVKHLTWGEPTLASPHVKFCSRCKSVTWLD